MGTKEKQIARFKTQPKDFTFNELTAMLVGLGFEMSSKGKTSGSRVVFKKGAEKLALHKPHPASVMKEYALKNVLNFLIEKGFIKTEE